MLKSRSTHPNWAWDKTIVGVISNSDDRVPSVLESFGLKVGPRRVGTSEERNTQAKLDDDIDFVILSYDVGFEKPDRRMFDAATQVFQNMHAGTPGNDGSVSDHGYHKLYIGDSLEHDYFGAKEAGWDAVLLDRPEESTVKEHTGSKETLVSDLYKEERSVAGVTKEVEMCSNLAALAGWKPHVYKGST